MKFSKLIIKNFRSIGPNGLEIIFSSDQSITAIIGPNGSGKTNVLSALGIVLGMYPFSRFSPEEADFHGKQSEEDLLIELYLDPQIVERDVYQREFKIAGFRYRAARYTRGDRKGSLHIEHYCFDDNGKTLVKPPRIYKKKTQTDSGVDNTPKPVLVGDQAWKLGNLFYIDPATLERFFDKTTGWSPLGRLFEIYREDFGADHNKYFFENGTNIPTREAFQKFSGQLAGILRTDKLKRIEEGLSSRMREYIGRTGGQPFNVEFSLPSHRELFEKWVALLVSDYEGLPALPIENLGSGYRALLRLAVLETLLDLNEDERCFILLVEEPEIYLHIHLMRYFCQVLKKLAGKGHQVLYTTHSPEFVDLAEPHSIIRLHRQSGGSTVAKQVEINTSLNFERVRQKVKRMGNEEVVFANHAILTEGQDDKGIIEELLIRKGINSDIYSISVINCDGAGQIRDYIRLCSELGIDFYVIHDQDDESRNDIKKRNESIASAVNNAKLEYPSLHIYKPTLETTMETEKKNGNLDHLLSLLGENDYATISKSYPNLVTPIDEFVQTRLKAEAIIRCGRDNR